MREYAYLLPQEYASWKIACISKSFSENGCWEVLLCMYEKISRILNKVKYWCQLRWPRCNGGVLPNWMVTRSDGNSQPVSPSSKSDFICKLRRVHLRCKLEIMSVSRWTCINSTCERWKLEIWLSKSHESISSKLYLVLTDDGNIFTYVYCATLYTCTLAWDLLVPLVIFFDTAWGFGSYTAMNAVILYSRDVNSLFRELVAYSADEYQVYFQSTEKRWIK
jgi:hypothetical protein